MYKELMERSRNGVSRTLREPRADITAQIDAMLDANHPKKCVFLASGNSLDHILPHSIFVENRDEGILLTTDAECAKAFRDAAILTDRLLANLLGYPQSKAELRGDIFAVQALSADGKVIFEAACDSSGYDETVAQAAKQGAVNVTSPVDVIARRLMEIA